MELMDIFGNEELPTVVIETLTKDSPNLADDLKEDFLDWLVNGKTEPPRAPGLHCSSLWQTCPRVPLLEARYAGYLKVQKDTAGQRLTYDVGHGLHHLVQNSLMGPFGRLHGDWKCLACQKVTHHGTMPLACPECRVAWRDESDGNQNIVYNEMFVADDVLKYCGHCDGIMLSREGHKFVFEFKTISKSQYRSLRAPKYAHIVQVHAYMNALGLKDAVVLYLDKGSQADWEKLPDGTWISPNPHIRAFYVKWDDDLWAVMEQRIRAYHEAEQLAKKLPMVEIEHVNHYARICTHQKCDLAADCAVAEWCFAI